MSGEIHKSSNIIYPAAIFCISPGCLDNPVYLDGALELLKMLTWSPWSGMIPHLLIGNLEHGNEWTYSNSLISPPDPLWQKIEEHQHF